MKNTATEQTTEKRTAIYARQSVDKKDSISVETQIELCRTRCGEDAVCIYTDRGFSGKNLKRPGYIKMTGDIACGKIRRVMVYRLDRLSRSVGDFSKMWEIFERYGVEFSSISEQFDTSTPIGKAMVYIIMTFAQLERETIAERVSDNYYSRIRTGAWPGGRAPFGFCNTRLISGGHSVPSLSADENAPTVRRIFSEYASSGRSLASIAKELSKEKSASAARSRGWDSKSLSRMLRSPVYTSADRAVLLYYRNMGIGTISNRDEEFDGTFSAHIVGKRSSQTSVSNPMSQRTLSLTNFPGIVDSGTWLRCQQRLDQNRQLAKPGMESPSWLSGILRCASCGYSIRIKKAGGRRYLSCSGRHNLHICRVSSFLVKIDELERQVESCISSLLSSSAEALQRGRKRQAAIDEEIRGLVENCALATDISMKYINEKIGELETEKQQLAKLDHLFSDSAPFSFAADRIFSGKKEAAALLIDRIEIDGRKIDIYWKTDI